MPVFEGYFLCFRQKRFSTEQAAEMIIADAADADDNSHLPAASGSEIESEPESKYPDSDTTDEEKLADNAFNDGMVPSRGLRTRGGYRQPENELIRKWPNSPNMKDGELRPVLKQLQQDEDSDPDMDKPLATITNSNKKRFQSFGVLKLNIPQTSLSAKTLDFSSTFQKTLVLLIFLNCF